MLKSLSSNSFRDIKKSLRGGGADIDDNIKREKCKTNFSHGYSYCFYGFTMYVYANVYENVKHKPTHATIIIQKITNLAQCPMMVGGLS